MTVPYTPARPPFWRNEKILAWISQIAVLAAVAGLGYFLWRNMITELRLQRDVSFTFSWLGSVAGFDIGERLIPYDNTSSYARAMAVGILNTLQVSVVGIAIATVLGVFWGLARLSPNYLIQRLATLYIEIFRNIPLLVLLIFWYQGLFLTLPGLNAAVVLPGPVFISVRGMAVPWGEPTAAWPAFLVVLGAALILAVAVFVSLQIRQERTGQTAFKTLWGLAAFLAVAVLGGLWLQPLTLSQPYKEGLRIQGGYIFSPEFLSILSALSIYSSAYIAENVRGGIQSVDRGQLEATSSLGLTRLQAMRLVVLPQAMRVIIPPLVSNYLGLIKNSSLAVAIGYPEFFHVAAKTTLNQTGRAVEIFLIVMGVYLLFSLVTSLILNLYNRWVQIVER